MVEGVSIAGPRGRGGYVRGRGRSVPGGGGGVGPGLGVGCGSGGLEPAHASQVPVPVVVATRGPAPQGGARAPREATKVYRPPPRAGIHGTALPEHTAPAAELARLKVHEPVSKAPVPTPRAPSANGGTDKHVKQGAPAPAPAPAHVNATGGGAVPGRGGGTRGGGRGGRGGGAYSQPVSGGLSPAQEPKTQAVHGDKPNADGKPSQQGANAEKANGRGPRKLQPSGFDMQPAPASASSVEAPESRDKPNPDKAREKRKEKAHAPENREKANSDKAPGKRKGSDGAQGSDTSEAYAKWVAEQERQEQIARQKRQDEAIARHLAAQQEAEERAACQAAFEEENAGPLAKAIKNQASTFWGQVASGSYKAPTGGRGGGATVDPKAAQAIAQALAALGDKSGVEAIEAGEELAKLVKAAGIKSFAECGVVENIRTLLGARETAEPALYAIKGCCEVLGGKAEVCQVLVGFFCSLVCLFCLYSRSLLTRAHLSLSWSLSSRACCIMWRTRR